MIFVESPNVIRCTYINHEQPNTVLLFFCKCIQCRFTVESKYFQIHKVVSLTKSFLSVRLRLTCSAAVVNLRMHFGKNDKQKEQRKCHFQQAVSTKRAD